MKCKICGPLKKKYCKECEWYTQYNDYEYGAGADDCRKRILLDTFTKYDTPVEHVHFRNQKAITLKSNRENNCPYWESKWGFGFMLPYIVITGIVLAVLIPIWQILEIYYR